MKLILASTSPRRIDLLKQAGFEIEVIPPGTDEIEIRGEAPKAMVLRLAKEKAHAVAAGQTVPCLIIAADTTVVAPNGKTIFGKPVDMKDAERMLKKLVGRTHTVLTGYCLAQVLPRSGGKSGVKIRTFSRVVRTRVKMRKLSTRAIQSYVKTGEPMGKAGSYAAQGIGTSMIDSLTGSYTNVVGLPISRVIEDLEKKFGILPCWSKQDE